MPAPSEPIDYRILLALRTQLRGMATRDGYFYDVDEAAVKLDPDVDFEALLAPDGPRPFVLIEWQSDRRQFIEKPDGLRIVLPIRIHWVNDIAPTTGVIGSVVAPEDEAWIRTYLRARADIEKAVCVDRSFGGLACDAILTTDSAADLRPQVWLMYDLEVEVYRTYGQPSQL